MYDVVGFLFYTQGDDEFSLSNKVVSQIFEYVSSAIKYVHENNVVY